MINVSVKVNEKNRVEIRLDYIGTQGIVFEQSSDTLNLDELNFKTGSVSQWIESATRPSGYEFSAMTDEPLAEKKIHLKTQQQTLHYSLFNRSGKRIEGVIDGEQLEKLTRHAGKITFQHEADLAPLKPHFSSLMNYITKQNLNDFYVVKNLPTLTANELKVTQLPALEFLGKPPSYNHRNNPQMTDKPSAWQTYIRRSTLYEIPVDHQGLALNLIALLHAYVAMRVHAVRDYCVDDRVKDGVCQGEIKPDVLFGNRPVISQGSVRFTAVHPLIEQLLKKMTSLPHYGALVNALQTVYRYANDYFLLCQQEGIHYDEALFSEVLLNPAWAKVILEFGSPSFLYDKSKPLTERQSRLEQMIPACLKAGRLDELRWFIREYNAVAVTQFLKEHTANKKAYSGDLLQWEADGRFNSTEVRFLSGSVFSLSHGRIRVLQHTGNPYYKFYTSAENSNLLTPEVSFLLKDVLQCDAEEGDFHQGIVFTEAASEQLMNLGLHFNADYLENLITQCGNPGQKPIFEKTGLVQRTELTPREKHSIASVSAVGFLALKTIPSSQASLAIAPSPSPAEETPIEENKCCCRLL